MQTPLFAWQRHYKLETDTVNFETAILFWKHKVFPKCIVDHVHMRFEIKNRVSKFTFTNFLKTKIEPELENIGQYTVDRY